MFQFVFQSECFVLNDARLIILKVYFTGKAVKVTKMSLLRPLFCDLKEKKKVSVSIGQKTIRPQAQAVCSFSELQVNK